MWWEAENASNEFWNVWVNKFIIVEQQLSEFPSVRNLFFEEKATFIPYFEWAFLYPQTLAVKNKIIFVHQMHYFPLLHISIIFLKGHCYHNIISSLSKILNLVRQ